MEPVEVNELIRTKLLELIDSGWLKTHIGKILLGPNGQAHLNHFLKEGDLPNDFGLKPLVKVGNVVNYDLHIAFIKADDTESIQQVNDMNHDFVDTLIEDMVNYLSKNTNSINLTRGGKSQIDGILDDLLDL